MTQTSGGSATLRTLLRCLLALGLFASAAAASAKALTPVVAHALPFLADGRAPVALLVIDAHPVLLADGAAWRLADDERAWAPLVPDAAPAGSRPRIAVGDSGKYGFVLDAGGDGAVSGAARLALHGARLRRQPLPPLPKPLHAARADLHAGLLTVAGLDPNQVARLYRLDTAAPNAPWLALAPWPGAGAPTSLVAQTSAILLSQVAADGSEHLWRWKEGEAWTDRGRVPGRIVPGAARATGQAHVLYLVVPAAAAPAQLRSFQTITNAWAGLPGVSVPAATLTAGWKDGMVWAAPRAGGGLDLATAQVQSTKVLLRWLDWLVIITYLGGMIGIGLYFYLREKRNSTANFFVGGRSIPFWAAGVSLYAANTSSISFIAIPAKAFETNWQYLTNNLIAVIGLMFVAVWIVPLLRRLDLMSVFSYLETRFHPGIRMMASGLAILTQIGSRMSVILLLPALAISTITGINVTLSIVLMGGFTIVYTAMGGMKAVIWTDFVQVIVKMGGAIFAIFFMVWALKGGFHQAWSMAVAEDKMHLFDFSFDLTKATVWGFIFLVLFDVVLTFPKDQVLMQRTLSTKSDKEAGRSIWMLAAIMIPGGFVFYGIGTALFVYYKTFPERMNPLLPIDATFPLFIGAELPPGVTGLIIAGIFAAAMATLSGIMNSVSTLVSVDFYERLRRDRNDPDKSQKKSVFFAEIMTVLVGLVGIGVAVVLSRMDVHSLFDVSIELAGLLGGGFAGAYTLGMFTRRANSPGVAIGIGCSIVLTLVAWHYKLVHPYFYLAISILLCIVIGYLASLFFPAPTRSLAGLTIYGQAREAQEAKDAKDARQAIAAKLARDADLARPRGSGPAD
jgi:SSS family transporter